jgi:hypothetical protein
MMIRRFLVAAAAVCSVGHGCARAQVVTLSGHDSEPVGRIRVVEMASRSREVTNRLTFPIRIRKINSSCPCVVVKIEPESIPPGSTGIVTISAPVAQVATEQVHWATFEASSQDGVTTQTFPISMTYTAELSMLVAPMFMQIVAPAQQEVERLIVVRSEALEAINPRSFRIEGDNAQELRVASVSRHPIPSESRPTEQALAITIKGRFRTEGLREAMLCFETNESPLFEVPMQVRVLPALRAVPAGFIFLPNELGTEKTVLLKSRTGGSIDFAEAILVDEAQRPVEGVELHVVKEGSSPGLRAKVGTWPNQTGGRAVVQLRDSAGQRVGEIPFVWVPAPIKQ